MKRFSFLTLSFFSLSCLVLLSSCKSSDGLPLSRKEYEYVPPVMVATPTPEPEPVEVEEFSGEGSGAPEKKKGFFGRLFSRDKSKKDEEPTVERVGDTPAFELNEDGEPVAKDKPSDNVYRIKTGDALFISLTGSGGLDESIETLVDDEGAIKLRYIGVVKALGLSSTQLEREIEAEYTERQKIYKDVTVRVVLPNRFYSIGGEVRQPGRFPMIGRVTLSQAVVASGNFTEWADEKDITLVRNKERVKINFKKIRDNPNLDVELVAGDVVWVGRSTF